MTTQNPGMHARVAADSLERLLREVTSGRAQWTHPAQVRQAVADLTRVSTALAGALQQMTAAIGQLTGPGPQTRQDVNELHLAGADAATVAQHLQRARRAMH